MFTWTPFYKELAKSLLAYKNRQTDLIAILNEIKNTTAIPVIRLIDAQKPATAPLLTAIDPFTFFACFNRGLTDQNRFAIIKILKEKLQLKSDIPTDFSGIPIVDNMKSWFFPFASSRQSDDIPSLWNLAESALAKDPEQLDSKLFNRCLDIDTVGIAKLTMGLFWLNPDKFLALDEKNTSYFATHDVTTDAFDHATYVKLLQEVRGKLGTDFTKISRSAWETATQPIQYWAGGSTWGTEKKADEFVKGNFWQIGWDKDDDEPAAKKTWASYPNIKIGDEFAIKGLGGRYDLVVYYVGKVISKSEDGILKLQKLDRPLFRGKGPQGANWFDTIVPVTNRAAIDAAFYGKTGPKEPELAKPFNELAGENEIAPRDPLPESLNIILYGPPGTGKTYRLRNHYMEEYFTDRQAMPTPEERAAAVVKDLSWWEVIALALLDTKNHKASVAEILSHLLVAAQVRKSSNNNPRAMIWAALQIHTKDECPHVKYTSRSQPLVFEKDESSVWSIDAALVDKEAPELREILYGFNHPEKSSPPVAYRYRFTTFHQSFSYEDFIEGIKPQMGDVVGDRQNDQVSYEIKDGVFKEICREAKDNPAKKYALFIDEINRGNVASIFGELITLIEDDKRLGRKNQLTAVLPYSRKEFGVPDNLYIIGTMNTADRSVEALDTALRRRFVFEEMRPDREQVSTYPDGKVDLQKMFEVINARIEQLLDHDHCIGHAYFIGIENLDGLRSAFANKILPLLREYFYGNPAKVGMVLGDRFVLRQTNKRPFASGSWGADDLDEKDVFAFADVTKLAEADFATIYAEVHPGI